MPLKIRLARGGAKQRPFYRIVVADSRSPRDGRFKDKVGTYNPMVERDHPERLRLDEAKVRKWLDQGAQPTDRVARILSQATDAEGASLGLVPDVVIRETPKKSAPKAKAQQRMKEKAEKEAEAAEAAGGDAEAEDSGEAAEG